MNGKFFLYVHEGSHWLPTGKRDGYDSFAEAREEALKYVDDALPRNTVHVLQSHGYAYFGGDGGSYFSGEEGP